VEWFGRLKPLWTRGLPRWSPASGEEATRRASPWLTRERQSIPSFIASTNDTLPGAGGPVSLRVRP